MRRRARSSCPPGAPRCAAPHNLLNLCAALETLRRLGADAGDLDAALAGFRGLPHRLEVVAERDGVLWIDDSISTTPESALAAVGAFPERPVVLIGGGYDRGQDYAGLGAELARRGARVIGLPATGRAARRRGPRRRRRRRPGHGGGRAGGGRRGGRGRGAARAPSCCSPRPRPASAPTRTSRRAGATSAPSSKRAEPWPPGAATGRSRSGWCSPRPASLQVGAAFAVTLFDDVGAAGAAFLRLGLAAVVLWADLAPAAARRTRAGDLRLAGAFGVALGLMNWSIYESMARIPLGVAVTIEFAGPLLVAVLGSRRPRDGVWIVLAAAGILLLADPGGGSIDTLGVVFALLAAVCWMAYIHLSQRTGRVFPGGSGLAIAMAVGALVVLPAGVLGGGGGLVEPGLLGSALVVALASSVLPYSLELEALRRLPAAVFGVLMSLEPAVAALAGWIVLGQALGAREVAAIAMVVVASAGATLGSPPPSSQSRIET